MQLACRNISTRVHFQEYLSPALYISIASWVMNAAWICQGLFLVPVHHWSSPSKKKTHLEVTPALSFPSLDLCQHTKHSSVIANPCIFAHLDVPSICVLTAMCAAHTPAFTAVYNRNTWHWASLQGVLNAKATQKRRSCISKQLPRHLRLESAPLQMRLQ